MDTAHFLFTDQIIVINEMHMNNFMERDICDKIDNALVKITGYDIKALQSKDRAREKVTARQMGMFFYLLAGQGLDKSAMRFHRDHATAIYARNQIKNLYGLCNEKLLTENMDLMAQMTGIDHKLST